MAEERVSENEGRIIQAIHSEKRGKKLDSLLGQNAKLNNIHVISAQKKGERVGGGKKSFGQDGHFSNINSSYP